MHKMNTDRELIKKLAQSYSIHQEGSSSSFSSDPLIHP